MKTMAMKAMGPPTLAAPHQSATVGAPQTPLPFVRDDSSVPPPPVADEITGCWDEDTIDVDEDTDPAGASWPFVAKPDWCGSGDQPELEPPTHRAVGVTATQPTLRRPEEVDLEEFARLRAAADVGRRSLAAILAAAQLDGERWTRVGVIHIHLLDRHQRRGERATLDSFDDNYVDAFERERGWPVDADAYAWLELASERGVLEDELARQQIPAAALFPIKRVWLRRLVGDAELARAVREARRRGAAR